MVDLYYTSNQLRLFRTIEIERIHISQLLHLKSIKTTNDAAETVIDFRAFAPLLIGDGGKICEPFNIKLKGPNYYLIKAKFELGTFLLPNWNNLSVLR